MRPAIELDEMTLRANALAWKRFAGTSVRAVVKAGGYGWGTARIAESLAAIVDGFIVADVDELAELRRSTNAPAATLADTGPEDTARVVALGGIANITRADSLAAAIASGAKRIRVGLRLAAGWSAIDDFAGDDLIARIADSALEVEVWSHLADAAERASDSDRFRRFEGRLRECGVDVVARDLESTSSARERSGCDTVRIGVGLFGARLGVDEIALACAIRIDAPVVERFCATAGLRVGYGSSGVSEGTPLVVARCGYSDGFPRVVKPYASVLSVGMQYTVAGAEDDDATVLPLLKPESDLDALAAAATTIPHEVVCRLGRMQPVTV